MELNNYLGILQGTLFFCLCVHMSWNGSWARDHSSFQDFPSALRAKRSLDFMRFPRRGNPNWGASGERKTWQEAFDWCKSHNQALYTQAMPNEMDDMDKKLKRDNVQETWLALQAEGAYDNSQQLECSRTQLSGTPELGSCFKEYPLLCVSIKEDKYCDVATYDCPTSKQDEHVCIVVDVSKTQSGYNWFSSVRTCFQSYSRLMTAEIMSDPSVVDCIINIGMEALQNDSYIWLNGSNVRWKWIIGKKFPTLFPNWAPGEPSSIQKKCVKLSFYEEYERYLWYVEDCNTELPFTCQTVEENSLRGGSESGWSKNGSQYSHQEKKTGLILYIAFPAATVMIIILIIGAVCIIVRKKKKVPTATLR